MPAAPVVPILPLDVRTRNALAALEAEDLPGKGEVKAFYSRLSEIVRGYVGELYGVEALECTTTELLDSLHALRISGVPQDGLAVLMDRQTTSFLGTAEEVPDEEVINAIRSVPCHY